MLPPVLFVGFSISQGGCFDKVIWSVVIKKEKKRKKFYICIYRYTSNRRFLNPTPSHVKSIMYKERGKCYVQTTHPSNQEGQAHYTTNVQHQDQHARITS